MNLHFSEVLALNSVPISSLNHVKRDQKLREEDKSLIKAAGDWKLRNGAMSTCNQFSTAEPTTAPAKKNSREKIANIII